MGVVWSGIKAGAESIRDAFVAIGEYISDLIEKLGKTIEWFLKGITGGEDNDGGSPDDSNSASIYLVNNAMKLNKAIRVNLQDTVGHVKDLFVNTSKDKFDMDGIVLSYRGDKLRDNCTLASYEINEGSVLNLTITLE